MQPFDRHERVPCLRELDKKGGEFWVANPWLFSESGENLSAYERDGVFLNAGNGRFHNISFLSQADSSGDGRSAVGCDVTGDGMPELFLRQVGGGPLLVFENRLPKANWLKISLRGTKSNSFGIGSKVVCEAAGRRICRELYPNVNFMSQAPAIVHVGLGDATTVNKMTIRWPSGLQQVLTDVPANRHVVIREGIDKATEFVAVNGTQAAAGNTPTAEPSPPAATRREVQ